MFQFKMTSNSHRLSVFVRTSSTQIPIDPLPRRSCGPSPWHMKQSRFLRLRCQRVSSGYNRPMTRQEENRRHTFPAKTVYLPAMQAVRLFTSIESFAQSARNLHRPQIQIHGDILKSVAVALVVKMISSSKNAINDMSKTHYRRKFLQIAKKHPRLRKIISVIRKRRQTLQLISNSLAFVAFSVFILWDIQHLSHDELEPLDLELQLQTAREDPSATLSIAREELRRMLKEKRRNRAADWLE